MKEEMEHSFEQEIWRVKQEDTTMATDCSLQDGSFKLAHAFQRSFGTDKEKEMLVSCSDLPHVPVEDLGDGESD
jgi:hypothetical protein